jgi:3-deoxy-D-manno-octulosonic-acid transferase
MAAAEALAAALLEADPQATVLLSAGNRQAFEKGRRIAESLEGAEGPVFLPWDRYGALLAWLSEVGPAAVAVVETEIWPSLFFACRSLAIPIAIVSGRIEPADAARYRLARPFFRRVLSCASWIGAQDEAEAARFRAIGAPADRIAIAGNLKADVPTGERADAATRMEALPADGLLLLAASTHRPEEEILLRVFARLRGNFAVRLVLAPRHARRASGIARLARREGLREIRWSSPPSGGGWDVLLLDEPGWLASFYRRTDVAFVGGSLVRRGGHNLYEAAAGGRPIVVGRHTENFREMAERLERAEGLARVGDETSLEACLRELLADSLRREAMGRAALSVSRAARGSSRLHLEAVRELLSRGGAPGVSRVSCAVPRGRSSVG